MLHSAYYNKLTPTACDIWVSVEKPFHCTIIEPHYKRMELEGDAERPSLTAL